MPVAAIIQVLHLRVQIIAADGNRRHEFSRAVEKSSVRRLPSQAEVDTCHEEVDKLEEELEYCRWKAKDAEADREEKMAWLRKTQNEADVAIRKQKADVVAREQQVARLRGAQDRLYKEVSDEVDAASAVGVEAAYAQPQTSTAHRRLVGQGGRAEQKEEATQKRSGHPSGLTEEERLTDAWLACGKLCKAKAAARDACNARFDTSEQQTWDRWQSYDRMKASSSQTQDMLNQREAILDKEIETVEASIARLEARLS